MNFKDHLKKEKLDRLTDLWKYLTPFQRFQIYFLASYYTIKNNAVEFIHTLYRLPIHILKNLTIYQYPAHWL